MDSEETATITISREERRFLVSALATERAGYVAIGDSLQGGVKQGSQKYPKIADAVATNCFTMNALLAALQQRFKVMKWEAPPQATPPAEIALEAVKEELAKTQEALREAQEGVKGGPVSSFEDHAYDPPRWRVRFSGEKGSPMPDFCVRVASREDADKMLRLVGEKVMSVEYESPLPPPTVEPLPAGGARGFTVIGIYAEDEQRFADYWAGVDSSLEAEQETRRQRGRGGIFIAGTLAGKHDLA